jgi:hypothetical protein
MSGRRRAVEVLTSCSWWDGASMRVVTMLALALLTMLWGRRAEMEEHRVSAMEVMSSGSRWLGRLSEERRR